MMTEEQLTALKPAPGTTPLRRLSEIRQFLEILQGELQEIADAIPSCLDAEGWDGGADLQLQIRNAAEELDEACSNLCPLDDHMYIGALTNALTARQAVPS